MYNEILHSNKKEREKGRTINSHSNVNEFQKHAEWNKPDTKEYLLYDSVYIKS